MVGEYKIYVGMSILTFVNFTSINSSLLKIVDANSYDVDNISVPFIFYVDSVDSMN